jgi:hypothetical protein
MTSLGVIPQELVAALEALNRFVPEASRRAAASLELILDRWRATRHGPYGSKLTGDGFPVEFVFSSLDTAVRYTSEIAGPGLAPRERFGCALDLLDRLGQAAGFPLKNLQEGCATLHWGAWVGGRHTSAADRYKLYAEAPENLMPVAHSELDDALGRYRTLLESHAYVLRMTGFEPASGNLELYFYGRAMEPQELRKLLFFAGLASQEEDFFSLLEEASQHPARLRLPGTQHGFSVSLARGGEVETFTFFVFARSLFGTDISTRSSLLTLSERRGWNLEQYAAVSATLQRSQSPGPCHGIVSFIVKRRNPLGVSVGLRPWIS